MPTYDKNLHYLKEAIFAKLNDDATLKSLLGATGRIYHRNPPKAPQYPSIVYSIISDRDNVFNEDRSTGEVTGTYFRTTIFSKSKKTEELDNLEARVKALLHGQTSLNTSKVICYSCFRENLLEPRKDPDLQIWIYPIRYRVVWAVK